VQQLSLLAPQSVIPAPPGAQLGGFAAHAPFAQNGVPPLHAVAPLHCPHPSHSCGTLPAHWVAPGRHTGASAHEHAPHAQLALHVCVPYVLHPWVEVGAQP